MQISQRWFLTASLLICFAFGAWLRLDQIVAQVLVNDEWHPVHALTYYGPGHIVRSFGNADYSIPLVLLYWLEMKWFGVSELMLRMPMIVAGLATLIAMPLALRNRVDECVVIVFAMLLAIAPFVISYARIGRSYAVTLFGIYLAYWCFERTTRAFADGNPRPRPAIAYAVLCGLTVWMHVITGPMLVAPLVALWWETWRGTAIGWRPVIRLTLIVGVLMSIAVLPPLIGDPQALAGKSGVDHVTLQTVYGALFFWFGTGSVAIVVLSVLFAAAGATTVWRAVPIARWATLGALMTVAALLASNPWWVDRPLAFGRYLLPATPVLLLMVAAGIVRVGNGLLRVISRGRMHPSWTLALAAPFLLACWITSPMPEILGSPNSYTQDSYFQYDYRKELNPVRGGIAAQPRSVFWASLAVAPSGSLTVAVAPFRYATYEWPAPLWELESHQRVIPAYIWGSCEATVHGEVPPDERFRFRNAAHLKSREMLVKQQVDYLAYYRMPMREGFSPPKPQCEAWVRENFGQPDYEDEALIVWHIRRDAPTPQVLR